MPESFYREKLLCPPLPPTARPTKSNKGKKRSCCAHPVNVVSVLVFFSPEYFCALTLCSPPNFRFFFLWSRLDNDSKHKFLLFSPLHFASVFRFFSSWWSNARRIPHVSLVFTQLFLRNPPRGFQLFSNKLNLMQPRRSLSHSSGKQRSDWWKARAASLPLISSSLLRFSLQLEQIIALHNDMLGKKKEQQNNDLLLSSALCCFSSRKKSRGEAKRSEGKEKKPKNEQFNCVLLPKELRCASELRCRNFITRLGLVEDWWKWNKSSQSDDKLKDSKIPLKAWFMAFPHFFAPSSRLESLIERIQQQQKSNILITGTRCRRPHFPASLHSSQFLSERKL